MTVCRRHIIRSVACLLAAVVTSPAVMAQQLAETMSAPDALEAVASGKAILVDIRSRQEWAETGLAQPALPISMHEPGFLQQMLAAMGNDRSRPVALICATGGRTRYVQNELRKLGFTSVIDVSEGMEGSSAGPGWLKRGLAVRPFKP